MNAHEKWLEATMAHTVALAFWRGVCADRAMTCDNHARTTRAAMQRAERADNRDEAFDLSLDAERYEDRAAWLRECAGAS